MTTCLSLTNASQVLEGCLEGECSDFEAASGHGLKCVVSGVESYAHITEWKYIKGLTRHVQVSTDHSLMQDDLTGASPTRQYQVRVEVSRIYMCIYAMHITYM